MVKIELEVKGIEELQEALLSFQKNIETRSERAVEKACEDTAKHIRDRYIGGGIGFKDRTGMLRKSITGGLVGGKGLDSVGHISAGDDVIGSDGALTRNYVAKVEFGEFSRAGKTAFLRPGVLESKRKILETIIEFLKPDNIL